MLVTRYLSWSALSLKRLFFCGISGDYTRTHDEEYGRDTPFGGRIALGAVLAIALTDHQTGLFEGTTLALLQQTINMLAR